MGSNDGYFEDRVVCHHDRFLLDCPDCEVDKLRAELLRLKAVVVAVHDQHADDLCWLDIDLIFAAFGLPVPDRKVGDKAAMKRNCDRFIDIMCAGGGWTSYADLEAERDRLRAANERKDKLLLALLNRCGVQSDILTHLATKKGKT